MTQSWHLLPSSFLFSAFLLTGLLGCDGCDGEGAGNGLEAHGSVANAERQNGESRTQDGLEIIQAHETRSNAPVHEGLIREPNAPDPHDGEFSLSEAVEGMPTDGQLVAEINTSLGTIFCDLYAERVPNTVANFIGLARGKRAWWDARAGDWRLAPAFESTLFHRVLPDYLIQGGDYLGDGSGTVGYTIPDEPHEELRHDRAGLLCMASTGPDSNGAQFFITDGATPDLDVDDQFTIFGRCEQESIVRNIARVPQGEENRPLTDVEIERIQIRRVTGGAAVARRARPQMPEGVDPDRLGREASPGPSELYIPERGREGQVFDPQNWARMREEANN